jgi:MFS family permease
MIRPFVLFAYPAVLWSSLVYALAVGWLIVLSESVAHIYQNRDSYNFTALQVGLVYIAPFVGGVLGTAVAGKVSDLIVRFMARRNDGVYEPEFRLVMAVPITISTVIGLMGFGWSAEEKDLWIVVSLSESCSYLHYMSLRLFSLRSSSVSSASAVALRPLLRSPLSLIPTGYTQVKHW